MKLFQQLLKFLQTLGIFMPKSNQKCKQKSKTLFFLLTHIQLIISSGAFFLFQAKSIREYIQSLNVTITLTLCVNFITICKWKMNDILKLIEKFEAFIEKRSENESSKSMYNELNDEIERITKLIQLVLTRLTLPGTLLPYLVQTVISYLVLDRRVESFYLPFFVVLPFNLKTISGYFVAFLIQYGDAYVACLGASAIISFFIGCCRLIKSFAKDITQDLIDFNVNSWNLSNGNYVLAKQTLCNISQNMSDVKQLVKEFNGIYEFIITDFFSWMVVVLCGSLLTLQFELELDLNPILSVTFVLWTLLIIFVFAEFGELMASQFELFNLELQKCSWFLFPKEMRQMLIILMANAQEPTMIIGFGNIFCVRQVFGKTVQRSFSYFMTLRQIDG